MSNTVCDLFGKGPNIFTFIKPQVHIQTFKLIDNK